MNALVDVPGTLAKMLWGKFENLKGLTNLQLRYLQRGAARGRPRETARRCGGGRGGAKQQRRRNLDSKEAIQMLNVKNATEINVPNL